MVLNDRLRLVVVEDRNAGLQRVVAGHVAEVVGDSMKLLSAPGDNGSGWCRCRPNPG